MAERDHVEDNHATEPVVGSPKQDDLQEREAWYRALIEHAPIAIVVHVEETIVFLNARAISVLGGASADDFVGRSIWDFIDQTRRKTVQQRIDTVYGQATTVPVVEERFLRLDGRPIDVEVMGAPVHFKGKPAVQAFFKDITARKRIEEALQESEERFRTLVEQINDVLFTINAEGHVTYISPVVERLFGYTPDEITGQPFAAFIHPDDLESVRASFQRTLSGVLEPSEYRVRSKSGDLRYARSFSRPIFENNQPAGIRGVLVDITERKKIEHERERLIAELEAKNAELERFTYTVSHDLKSPLVTIRGFLSLLERDARSGNTDLMHEDIAQIKEAAHKMQRLLNELLELSRIGRLINPSERASLTDLAHEAVAMVAGNIEENAAHVEIAPDMPVVFGDRVRLLEVFQNLLENAIKFSALNASPHIWIEARIEGSNVVCAIRDNGPGIALAFHEKIFGLFERLHQHVEGTGIGLALVKRIIEVHGGQIWVDSEENGQGSTFYFSLPREQVAEEE